MTLSNVATGLVPVHRGAASPGDARGDKGPDYIRKRIAAWLLLALSLVLTARASAEPDAALVTAVDCVGMTVGDADRSIAFFRDVLSFRTVSDVEVAGTEYEQLKGVFGLRMRVVTMQLGGERIALTEYLTPRGRAVPLDSRSNDRWFQHIAIIVSDMDRAYQHLRADKVEHASTGPQLLPAWNENAGGIRAFYFKDPDGHALEILQFPPDKGDAKWQRPTDQLFLGIDHTALVVHDTDTSVGFYRDTLGFRVAGESENYGTEQEHLNNVFGARLRITALRVANGPGIELLEYLAPRDGRPAPADLRANDLAHWQTTLLTTSVDRAVQRLRAPMVAFVSPGAVHLPNGQHAVMARDPDRHAVEVVERISHQ